MSGNVVIDTTAGNVAAELTSRGIDPDKRVVVFVLGDWLAEVRQDTRARVVAAGLSDDDIDRMIEEARDEVQHLIR